MRFFTILLGVIFLCSFQVKLPQQNLDSAFFVGRLVVLDDKDAPVNFGSCVPIKINKIKESYEVYFISVKHGVEGFKKFKIEIFAKLTKNILHYHFQPTISFPATLCKLSKKQDLSLFKVVSKEIILTSPFYDKPLKPFQELYTVGCPFGRPPHITYGTYSRKTEQEGIDLISAPIAPGNSGGAIYDKETGKLVGISLCIRRYSDMFGSHLVWHTHYMIATPTLKKFLEKNL